MIKKKFKKGDKVLYIGPDLAAYEKGKVYEISGFDEETGLYGVMSELDEAYCISDDVLVDIHDECATKQLKLNK